MGRGRGGEGFGTNNDAITREEPSENWRLLTLHKRRNKDRCGCERLFFVILGFSSALFGSFAPVGTSMFRKKYLAPDSIRVKGLKASNGLRRSVLPSPLLWPDDCRGDEYKSGLTEVGAGPFWALGNPTGRGTLTPECVLCGVDFVWLERNRSSPFHAFVPVLISAVPISIFVMIRKTFY